MREEVLLVYGMNGSPLLPQHGGRPIARSRVVRHGERQVAHADHRLPGRTRAIRTPSAIGSAAIPTSRGSRVSRMRVRSLMVPPGIPSFPERERTLTAGLVTLEGRAWSGRPIERVEVSSDGGVTWQDATVHPAADHAWHRWTYPWSATHGVYELACRATDATGATQPLRPEPNVGGYANNAVHRVRVLVTG